MNFDRSAIRAFGLVGGLGLYIGILLLVSVLGGNWLDEQLGTSPLFLIVGIFVGLGLAAYSLYRIFLGSNRLSNR